VPTLRVEGSQLVVELHGWERVWALRGSIRVDLGRATRCGRVPTSSAGLRWRVAGTSLPGVIRAGTFWGRRGWEFWYSRFLPESLVIEFEEGAPWARLVLDVDDAASWERRLALPPP
jgi:hypothetical protein